MKATFEFDIPEEQNEYLVMMYSGKFHSALWDIHNFIRDRLKHDQSQDSQSLLEKIKEMIPDCINEIE